MLTLLIAAAVLAACTGLRRFLNREGRKGPDVLGRAHPPDGACGTTARPACR